MFVARLCLRLLFLVSVIAVAALLFALTANAQTRADQQLKPVQRRLPAVRPTDAMRAQRKGGYAPLSARQNLGNKELARANGKNRGEHLPARVLKPAKSIAGESDSSLPSPPVRFGTPLNYVLHTSQLSRFSSQGTNEQLVDQNGDLAADERTPFDTDGGSFDIAVGRSGARYEVFTAVRNNQFIGALVLGLDTNGDFRRDEPPVTFDLNRDFGLPSAAAVVSGTSRAGREFIIVSSSGYYNYDDPGDPYNEPSAGVVLLVRSASTIGFDNTRSRELIRVGSNLINNANALALLPNNDLLIADYDSNEIRIVRDTDADGIPDRLDPLPYYAYRSASNAPLEIAANSRGVVFTHSAGNDTVLLALYDDDNSGYVDGVEIAVEGLSLDATLVLHGLTVDREGTVYVIEDAAGADDLVSEGGNLGTPRIDAFPDPAINGILRDGYIFFTVDDANSHQLTGLSFGVDTRFGPVERLTMTNAASLRGPGTRNGLAAISGVGLTFGQQGTTETQATERGVRVTIEGRRARVLSFSDSQINIHVPGDLSTGTAPVVASVVVSVNGITTAADDVTVAAANPGIFTYPQTGAGEAIALLVSGNRYTNSPFPARFNNQPSVVAIFGTGWRNSLPVSVTIGGHTANVQYAGPSGGFPGMDQLNVTIPDGVTGSAPVIIKAADGQTSRSDVVITAR